MMSVLCRSSSRTGNGSGTAVLPVLLLTTIVLAGLAASSPVQPASERSEGLRESADLPVGHDVANITSEELEKRFQAGVARLRLEIKARTRKARFVDPWTLPPPNCTRLWLIIDADDLSSIFQLDVRSNLSIPYCSWSSCTRPDYMTSNYARLKTWVTPVEGFYTGTCQPTTTSPPTRTILRYREHVTNPDGYLPYYRFIDGVIFSSCECLPAT